jgi:hypothetical protein
LNETVRPGVQDRDAVPTRVVCVERLAIRHQADHVWLLADRLNDERMISCSLNLSWPDADLDVHPDSIDGAEAILQALASVVESLAAQSRAQDYRSSVEDGQFEGWLSYPSVERAAAAMSTLRDALREHGLAIKQWSRELIIPRQHR